MADETISTRIVANADFSALIADVHKVTASLSKLQEQLANSNKMLANQIAVMNRSFSDTLRSTGQFSTHFVSLQSDVEKFGKNLDGGKLKLNQYFNTFRQHAQGTGGLIRDLAKQQVALQNAVLQPLGRNAQGLMQFNVHVPRGLDEVKNKTAIARQELQIMNKVIQDGAGQLINWGKNTQWAGRQLTVGLTVPLAAFGKAAADAFRQADQELVRLTKVYGDVAGTSAQELGKVREDVTQTAKEISAAMGVSFKETIGLAADIAATGKTGDELLGSIKETTRLAVLGEVDRQDAMKATLAIQSAFKQNTDELSQSINFLNAVENQTSTTLNDLVEAIPKAGPIIKGLGGSIEDLALYLTAMREGGVNASEGANALKSALASLINPTDVAVGKFKTLGIDLLGIVNNNAGNLTGTLMALQSALDTLNPLQKQQAIEQLFGKFQFSRLNALFENLGRQGSQTLQVLDLMKASSDELAAVAGRELTAVTESASGKYRRALESLKASLADVGEQFLTINTALIQVIDKVVQFANNLPGPVKQILALLGGVTAIAGPLIMITGVLANFFGYMMKGVFHMKAFFKGGEGWKYLTPEILAAEKAGKLVEQSFYSDAKAAAVLKQALGNLIDEFSVLEAKAKAGALSVNPAVSTMAGNLVMAAGGGRVVNPQHPLVGPMGTRASSHMVPRSGMTEQERLAQTMFGMVPGSGMVNQKIGQNPQIYMNDALPNVPGLTSVGGVSTGIVSGEAARWHSMMATLAMQSKAEIEALKKQIVATGTVSREFMMQFDDILPVVSKLTDNAARESALIVAELRAGKLTVESAKAKIIALNLETERMISSAVTTQAAAMGRTINPTMVPTLNQPVVDPTGKSNMRELFKKGRTRDFINKVAGALGVRTSGAGYNIETTVPRKMNSGGYVYTMNDGNIVPGPNVNRDIVPAILTPGEFVVNKEATQANLGLLKSINDGGYLGSSNDGYMPSGVSNSILGSFGYNSRSSKEANLVGRWGMILPQSLNDALAGKLGGSGANGADIIAALQEPGRLIDLEDFLLHNGVSPQETKGIMNAVAKDMASKIVPTGKYRDAGLGQIAFNSIDSKVKALESRFPGISLAYQKDRMTPGRRDTRRTPRPGETQAQANKRGGSSPTGINIPGQRPSNYGAGATRGAQFGTNQVWAHLDDMEFQKNTSMLSRSMGFIRGIANPRAIGRGLASAGRFAPGRRIPGAIRFNSGGMVPSANGNKYNMGGMVQGYEDGGPVYGPKRPNVFQEARSKGFFGQSLTRPRAGGGMSPMAGMGAGMAMQFGGQMMGGTAGTVMQMASILPMIAPGGLTKVLAIVPKIISGFTSMTKIISVVRSGLVLLTRALPGGIAIAAIIGLVKAFQAWRKNVADAKRDSIALNGITEKGAKELGIKYTSLTDKIKLLREEQKLAADKARSYFESYSSSGVKGLTLTIQQLKELKERVKTDMPEMIDTFNNIDASKVNDLAANLKAQMLASGKSVEEATNLIYALVEASDKAGMGVSAISNKAFAGITDKGSAASFVLKNLAQNIKDVTEIDPSAFASNVDTAITSLDAAVSSLIGTKDESGKVLDEAGAIAIQFEKMTESGIKNNKLGEETLKTLKAQRPEFANILNKSDTIGGMYAKWRLMLAGVKIDLKAISSAQAETLATFEAGLQAAADTALLVGNNLNGVANVAPTLKKVTDLQKAAQTAAEKGAKGTAGLDKAKIKAIQDEIKAIRERAEARKRALRETFDRENAELELQQAKLDLQSAIARGDNEAAAAAQIRIQQIQKEASIRIAEANYDEKARKEEAIQQKLLDDDAAAKDKAGQNVNTNQNAATNLAKSAKTISDLTNQITSLGTRLSMLNPKSKDYKSQEAEIKMLFSNVMQDVAKAANLDKYVAEAFSNYLNKDAKGKYIPAESKTYMFPRRGEVTMGGAFDNLKALSGSMSSFSLDLMGKDNRSLTDIYNIMAKGESKSRTITPEDLQKAIKAVQADPAKYSMSDRLGIISSAAKKSTDKDGYLTDDAREVLLNYYNMKKNDTFKYGSEEYRTTIGADAKILLPKAVRKAMGGYVRRAASGVSGMTGSQPYLVGERGPELFVPSSGGQIIPNNILGASYNIPSGRIGNISGMGNSSSSNIVYNIDIDLNGTNVTADDIMRRFKAELALVNAKEGRSRTLGGNY